METLHILNGEEMKKYFQRTDFLKGEPMVPFNEAMCEGELCEDIFSEEFVKKRALTHEVGPEEYSRITLQPLQLAFEHPVDRIDLWFDEDMFCQINLLTMLAWLDQQHYLDKAELRLVHPQFEPIASYTLNVSGWHTTYKQVLLDKTSPSEMIPHPLRKGIELYLDYWDDNVLVRFVEEHSHVLEEKLVQQMIGEFRNYGLGDVQYLKLIRRVRASYA
ncbi:AraC family transcriptional regulator [Halobacillus sp. A5]|uniref:AraC family transcriptional regulator n=1 Tax=Halobacillus sp. A5 TaxID=2880263 RepID=UPI0020A6490B|nr:AraC family transcriptional regulator [Halobacillus sp. A5]MCP3027811.1 AraC family transcriptional regulator [Halobacillus sp. A5]